MLPLDGKSTSNSNKTKSYSLLPEMTISGGMTQGNPGVKGPEPKIGNIKFYIKATEGCADHGTQDIEQPLPDITNIPHETLRQTLDRALYYSTRIFGCEMNSKYLIPQDPLTEEDFKKSSCEFTEQTLYLVRSNQSYSFCYQCHQPLQNGGSGSYYKGSSLDELSISVDLKKRISCLPPDYDAPPAPDSQHSSGRPSQMNLQGPPIPNTPRPTNSTCSTPSTPGGNNVLVTPQPLPRRLSSSSFNGDLDVYFDEAGRDRAYKDLNNNVTKDGYYALLKPPADMRINAKGKEIAYAVLYTRDKEVSPAEYILRTSKGEFFFMGERHQTMNTLLRYHASNNSNVLLLRNIRKCPPKST